jgi:hypothetical protein
MKNMSKKGFSITEVPVLAITFGVIAIILGVMATVLTQVQNTQVADSFAYNITQQGLQAQTTLSGWQQTWIVIVASAVVLGIISAYLFFKPGN